MIFMKEITFGSIDQEGNERPPSVIFTNATTGEELAISMPEEIAKELIDLLIGAPVAPSTPSAPTYAGSGRPADQDDTPFNMPMQDDQL